MITNDKLFGCPYCGFRISPGDKLCTRCGNKFGAGTKFECPFCGELVAPSMQECPTCHVNFDEFQTRVRKTAKTDSVDTLLMEIIRLEATEVAREGKKLSCPSCDLLLDGSESSCPRCNMDLTEGAAFQCPVCGEFVAPEAMKCSTCGANFAGGKAESEEAQAAADHEAVSSALDDILNSAGHTGPLPEPEPRITEPPPEPPTPEEVEPPPPPDFTPEDEPKSYAKPVTAVTASSAPPKKARTRKLKSKPSGTTVKTKANP